MPYIVQELRQPFRSPMKRIVKLINTKGKLTYVLYAIAVWYMRFNKKEGYDALSEIAGSMMDAALEFRRNYLDKHEERKKFLNGDV